MPTQRQEQQCLVKLWEKETHSLVLNIKGTKICLRPHNVNDKEEMPKNEGSCRISSSHHPNTSNLGNVDKKETSSISGNS